MYKNMIDFFQDTVEKFRNKDAVIHNKENITFENLNYISKKMAMKIIQECDQCINEPIAVFLPKCINTVITDIAITYSCNIFMNLDINMPKERLKNILELIKPKLLITDNENIEYLEDLEHSIKIINIDTINKQEEKYDYSIIFERLNKMIDTDPYCIINTSGSTGTPKGVVLNHKSFFDFLQWSIQKFKFNGSEVIGSLSPVIFDIYNYELCLMMSKGSTIELLDSSLATFPIRLLEKIVEKNVNFLFWVPSIMVNIANMDLLSKIKLPMVKTIWFAGEVFPTKQFNYWKKHLPKTVFANLYGPIEITLDCIYFIVNRELSDEEVIPIGNSCENTDILLLKDNNERCNDGEIGEICVRGTSLAMGYYNNFEKTSKVFVQNPLNKSYPELIYRTGDLAFINDRKEIIFKGRKDSLIKHMGYRIELGEIEHVLVNTLKLLEYCCAVYDNYKKCIILFYETKNDLNDADIRQKLLNVFPKYMIPTKYIKLNELPRNTNGKIDRLKLTQQVNLKK